MTGHQQPQVDWSPFIRRRVLARFGLLLLIPGAYLLFKGSDQQFSVVSGIGAGLIILTIILLIRFYNSICPNCQKHYVEHKPSDVDWWYLVRGFTTRKCHSCGARVS